MSLEKQKALEILKTDGLVMVEKLASDVFLPLLKKAIEESPNKIDDMVYPFVETFILKALGKI